GLQALRDRSGSDARYSALLREVRAEFPGVVVVDARRVGYPTSAFHDPIHLNRKGAGVLSADLAAIIERRGSPAGLVSMPAYRPRRADEGLEDFEQSRLSQKAIRESSIR